MDTGYMQHVVCMVGCVGRLYYEWDPGQSKCNGGSLLHESIVITDTMTVPTVNMPFVGTIWRRWRRPIHSKV